MTRVLHILDGGFQSGAGRGCLWLQQGLQSHGVVSSFLGRLGSRPFPALVMQEVSAPERLYVGVKSFLRRQQLKLRYRSPLKLFSPLHDGYRLHRYHSYDLADLIHIHWTTGTTFSHSFWRRLAGEARPVVWTMRDMWPFTGGCHYSSSCIGYQTRCGSCPVLGAAEHERITAHDAAFKQKHLPPNAVFVAISEWMRRRAQRSTALTGRDIRVIHNCLPPDHRFGPVDRRAARAALGIPADVFVASAGALHFSAAYKGAYVLRDLIQRLGSDPTIHFLLFGGDTHLIARSDHPRCKHQGRLNDDEKINLIYAASDVFLMPSLQEAFGKATIESMAAGTPVIGFRDTATEELIEEGRTGWLAPLGDVDRYAACLARARALSLPEAQAMRKASMESARWRFSSEAIASQYVELYRELLHGQVAAR